METARDVPELGFQASARLFLWAPVVMAAGIAAYFSLAIEPEDSVFYVALLGLIISGRMARRGSFRVFSFGLCLFLAGFVLAKARMEAVQAPAIERRMGPIMVSGLIEDADIAKRRQMRLIVKISEIEGLDPSITPRRLVLMVPGSQELIPGAQMRVAAELRPLLTPVAPGAYDGARAQWFAGIGGTGFAREAAEITGQAPGPLAYLARLRLAMGERISAVLKDDAAAFAEAIITGERSRLSDDATEAMQISGLAHIISISGLHMSLVAGGVFWFVRAVLALFPHMALYHPIKKYAAFAGLIVGAFYVALSGMQVAATRSFLMVAIMFMAILMDRRALSMHNVALAGFAPESILSASFQMSFLAVIGIIALHENLPPQQADAGIWARGFRMFWIAGSVSLVAGIYSGIPAAYHFHRLSPYSLPANMLAAPVVGFLVMPMALASALLMPLGLEAWALWALGIGLDGVLAIAGLITQLPGAAKRIAEPSILGVLLIAFAALWFGLWRGRLRYYAGLFLLIGLGLSGVKDRPDILIERTARNVAVRLDDGRLAFAHSRRGRFAAERWLAAEADNAKLSEAAKRGWQCAEGVCEIWAKGRRILFVQELSQFKCLAGDIIIADYPLRGACRNAALRIDRIDVWRNGAEVVFIRPDKLIVKTAQGERGRRPWVTQVKPRLKPAAAQSSSITAQ